MSWNSIGFELFERVREWVVTDVMEQRGKRNQCAVGSIHICETIALAEHCKRATCEMVHADSMIEPRVRRTRIYEVCVTELFDVAETLERCAVHNAHSWSVKSDRVPQRIAYCQPGHSCFFFPG